MTTGMLVGGLFIVGLIVVIGFYVRITNRWLLEAMIADRVVGQGLQEERHDVEHHDDLTDLERACPRCGGPAHGGRSEDAGTGPRADKGEGMSPLDPIARDALVADLTRWAQSCETDGTMTLAGLLYGVAGSVALRDEARLLELVAGYAAAVVAEQARRN